eukprot:TRINITY_DN27673_c0_g1_i1.p1 TRINITY_DN27673_c0_g1~~TRINITY_DN27673_c0_g1_i1.p1  ORF type:complete len:573 (-),score=144.16 TRINITY_DN27673_c0_g1_i1:194-1840(-)
MAADLAAAPLAATTAAMRATTRTQQRRKARKNQLRRLMMAQADAGPTKSMEEWMLKDLHWSLLGQWRWNAMASAENVLHCLSADAAIFVPSVQHEGLSAAAVPPAPAPAAANREDASAAQQKGFRLASAPTATVPATATAKKECASAAQQKGYRFAPAPAASTPVTATASRDASAAQQEGFRLAPAPAAKAQTTAAAHKEDTSAAQNDGCRHGTAAAAPEPTAAANKEGAPAAESKGFRHASATATSAPEPTVANKGDGFAAQPEDLRRASAPAATAPVPAAANKDVQKGFGFAPAREATAPTAAVRADTLSEAVKMDSKLAANLLRNVDLPWWCCDCELEQQGSTCQKCGIATASCPHCRQRCMIHCRYCSACGKALASNASEPSSSPTTVPTADTCAAANSKPEFKPSHVPAPVPKIAPASAVPALVAPRKIDTSAGKFRGGLAQITWLSGGLDDGQTCGNLAVQMKQYLFVDGKRLSHSTGPITLRRQIAEPELRESRSVLLFFQADVTCIIKFQEVAPALDLRDDCASCFRAMESKASAALPVQ